MFFSLLWCVTGCLPPPNYPSVPQIAFENLRFVDASDKAQGDSLILSLRFQDGEGDLGLQDDDVGARSVNGQVLYFNDKFYFTKNYNKVINYVAGERLTYADKRQRSEFKLPDYVRPYSCINWEIRKEQGRTDTVYFELNPNYYDIFVDFYIKQNDGSFALFDWRKKFCTTFNGRLPVVAKSVNEHSPLKGVIHYAMVSVGFKVQFSIKTLKLKVRIQDRMQQMSNEIETPEFQFR